MVEWQLLALVLHVESSSGMNNYLLKFFDWILNSKTGWGGGNQFKIIFDGYVFPGTLYVKLLDNDQEMKSAKGTAF